MNKVFTSPSFYAHIFNSITIILILIILYNNFSKIINIEPYKLLMLISIFSIVIGIHGISHLGLEYIYNYNPIYSII